MPTFSEERGVWISMVLVLAGLAFMVHVVAFLMINFPETGPNCPDRDPTWRGRCSEAPLPV